MFKSARSFKFFKNNSSAKEEDETKVSLNKMEKGEPPTEPAKKPEAKHLELCSSLRGAWDRFFDRSAWRSLTGLLTAFRFTQYLDMSLVITAFVVTVHGASKHNDQDVQIPVISMMIAVASLPVPWIGVYASLRMKSGTIAFVAIFALVTKLIYPALLLVYLYKGPGKDEEKKKDFTAEMVLAIHKMILSLYIIYFGYKSYKKLSHMKRNKKNVLFIGLDGAGKSLLLDTVVPHETSLKEWEINPTGGLDMYEFQKFDNIWKIWDMSGRGRARSLWPYYYSSMSCIVFVIDSSDIKRLGTVKEEFMQMINHPDVKRTQPLILILLNKVDLPEVKGKKVLRINATQMRRFLQVDSFASKFKVRMQMSSGIAGSGVEEGLQWILDEAG